MEGESFLEVKDVSFSYGKNDLLDDISLSLQNGCLGALLGPNGSGKSTLLKIISGYLQPTRGSVRIDGRDIHKVSHVERRNLVTYVGDAPWPSFDFTVEETVAMGRMAGRSFFGHLDQRDVQAINEAISTLNLEKLKGRTLTSLSSGEYQRVEIARAFCQDPKVLLLDEPTAHLDMAYELELMEIIKNLVRESGKTVLAVFHDINLALRYASNLFFLKNGKIAFTLTPNQVTSKVIEEVYEVQATVNTYPGINSSVVVPISSLTSRPA